MAPPWGSATRLWSRGAPRLTSSRHARAAAPNDVAERHPSDLQLAIQEAVMNSSLDQNEPPVPPRFSPSTSNGRSAKRKRIEQISFLLGGAKRASWRSSLRRLMQS